ncbi:MAG: glycosyltransferase family 39 protein [Opitutae bacterium]|nr:glycosyltransferase family 39 protein [Opitutae bacterium]
MLLGLVLLLGAWVFWLRWPGLAFSVWNVDEAIHAAAARTILDGGVLYRDAIDQRTPLTYYAVAGLFRVFGENNAWALHAATAGLIALTAAGLFLIGRRWPGSMSGGWAAAVFCALSTNLFFAGDAFAANTEWAVAFFTTWSVWWFWRNWEGAKFWPAFGAGAGFGCAFLAKQPGMLDFGAPLAVVVCLWRQRRLSGAAAGTLLGGLVAGFGTVTVATFAYFAAHGTLCDFYQYAWTYNLVYYGPEITFGDRVFAFAAIVPKLWTHYPAILAALLLAAGSALVQLVQQRPTPAEELENPPTLFLLLWVALSLAGAAASGRDYDHYYIQCLPALSLLAAAGLARAGEGWRSHLGRWQKYGAGLLLLAAGWSVLVSPVRGRSPAGLAPDPALRSADFVRRLTAPDERIFVWGYNPDIYLFADRKPASRFLYCSFLTGLIPWTNFAPGVDTRYAIVPGTMETLLAELEERRPTFLVDCSAGPHRRFDKYPLAMFPRLNAWVEAHYSVAEPEQFVPQGFRLFLVNDSARRAPVRLAGGPAGSNLTAAGVSGPPQVDPVPTEFALVGAETGGRLQRLELLINGTPFDAVSFQPTQTMSVRMRVPFDRLGAGKYRLAVRAVAANGESRVGDALAVECGAAALGAAQAAEFALPHLAATVPPLKVRAPNGAQARMEEGRMVYFAHAPSMLAYELPAGATAIRGRYGFRPGAWAATNPGRTDGADFSISLIRPGGTPLLLHHRALRPVEQPADRAEQEFNLTLPAGARGRLEFNITPGPAGSAASDWTYWADLLLISSH